MSSDVKKDDSSIDNSIGIESSIVKIGDCSTDDINVNLEFYFGDQLIANETFSVSIKWFISRHDRCLIMPVSRPVRSGDDLIENIISRFPQVQNDCKDLREIEPSTKEPIIQNKSESILPKVDFQIDCLIFCDQSSHVNHFNSKILVRWTVWLNTNPLLPLLHQQQPAMYPQLQPLQPAQRQYQQAKTRQHLH